MGVLDMRWMRGTPQHIGRVCVVGLGKSGKSAARYCAALLGDRVDSLFIAAGARNDDSTAFVESLAGEGISWVFGDDAFEEIEASQAGTGENAASSDDGGRDALPVFDLCIASPGIPYWHPLYERGKALSRELVSEVEFAWRESAPDSVWVAITGTNGKTTTTACCAHALRACGFNANAVGNIGDVCLDAVAEGGTQVYVAELSSYQLYSTPTFVPDVAVMLNITPDHLHWHKTLEAYAQAKFGLLDNMTRAAHEGGATREGEGADVQAGESSLPVAILDATNDVVRSRVRELRAQTREERGFSYIPLGTADGVHGDMRARCGARNAAFLDGEDVLTVAFGGREHAIIAARDLQIPGEHNASNALAAAAVAVALGADDASIARGLSTFAPLAHRIEPCGSVAGIDCYNDSKATNVDATLKALSAFPGRRLCILLGGDDKGTDLADLVAGVRAHAQVAVCFGAAGPRFAEALAPLAGIELLHAEHLEDALDAALAAASAGDVVLLSPACASFDEFTSFEQRGDVFKRLVAERARRASGEAGMGA